MASTKPQPNLLEAVQSVFQALEAFDENARQRILTSATSLLGMGAAAIIQRVASTGISSASPQAPIRSSQDRPVSPVELLQEKKPATNPQRIALFAYYRERAEGLSRFSKDDLKQYFPKAKLPPPQNFDRDYGRAAKAGWIYDDGADSYLTSKGLEAAEAGFEGKGLPRGASVAKVRKGRRKTGRSER
jgi:hypothetical protein